MQMACEYNPSFYLCGDSRFDPPRLRPTSLMNRYRLELSKIMEDTCGAVIVTGNRAYFPTDLFRVPSEVIRLEGERTSRANTATVVR